MDFLGPARYGFSCQHTLDWVATGLHAPACIVEMDMRVLARCPATGAVAAGGGAALWAAAYLDSRISAVVVRDGRPDLAVEKLPAVTAPTLLLVGGNDSHVLDLNRAALQVLGSAGGSELVVVPRAGHLCEGPGLLEAVADAACEWFGRHLKQQQQQQQRGDKQAGVIQA
jgi:alpha-beta hydrolase superfamily lysophospholipase